MHLLTLANPTLGPDNGRLATSTVRSISHLYGKAPFSRVAFVGQSKRFLVPLFNCVEESLIRVYF